MAISSLLMLQSISGDKSLLQFHLQEHEIPVTASRSHSGPELSATFKLGVL